MAEISLNKPGILPEVEAQIEEFLEEFGAELVLLRLGRAGRQRTLTLFIDKPGGVTADDCQQMSQRVSVLLDVLDPFSGSYRLVVSSPGLDRPLTKDEHFRRFEGKEAMIAVSSPSGEAIKRSGTLAGLTGEAVLLQTADGVIEISKPQITDARLVVRWDD